MGTGRPALMTNLMMIALVVGSCGRAIDDPSRRVASCPTEGSWTLIPTPIESIAFDGASKEQRQTRCRSLRQLQDLYRNRSW